MILSPKNIAYYLWERGLISQDAIVDGDLLIVDTSRRNQNFRVIRKRGPGYFVKQIKNWDAQSIAGLKREALCYWLSQTENCFAWLGLLLPKYFGYDSSKSILITGLLAQSESLTDYHRRLGVFPSEIGTLLGKTLASYHQDAETILSKTSHYGIFPKTVPWVLSIHQQSPDLRQSSSGCSQLYDVIRKHPEFQQLVDKVRSQWRTDTLIHGDIRWDNFMVESPTSEKSSTTLRLVDWELADIGDAAWDIGAVFQTYLSHWILSINAPSGMPPDQQLNAASYPLEMMRPGMSAFWTAYCQAMGLDRTPARELLLRAINYAAVRMIQTVFECMYRSPQMTSAAFYLLQVSLNILKTPAEAVKDLLTL